MLVQDKKNLCAAVLRGCNGRLAVVVDLHPLLIFLPNAGSFIFSRTGEGPLSCSLRLLGFVSMHSSSQRFVLAVIWESFTPAIISHFNGAFDLSRKVSRTDPGLKISSCAPWNYRLDAFRLHSSPEYLLCEGDRT
jgi:hypothetical protein